MIKSKYEISKVNLDHVILFIYLFLTLSLNKLLQLICVNGG